MMVEMNLLRLGAEFAAMMTDYRAAQSQLSALQHEAHRTASDIGLVYGSSAWSEHRFAVTGRTVHHVNALYEKLEGVAQEIEPISPVCFADLLIKARAHHFTGNSVAIITEIEALAEANIGEAHPVCRPGTATCGNQRHRYDVLNSTLPGSPARQNRSTRPKEGKMNAKTTIPSGARDAREPNDGQVAANLAVLAKVQAEATGDADAELLNVIREHEAAFLAWDASGIEDGLSEGPPSPENRAAYEAETRFIFAPCRSYADVLAKIGYIYHRETAAAQDAYDAVVGRDDDFLGFLGSLIGIEAPEMRAAADETGNDTLIDVIQAYRAGVKAYADHPEFSSHDEENEVAEATYGVHADKLDKWDAPATSREEAVEALRFALEDAAQWCGSVTSSTMIKAALGYLEGGERVPGGGASTGQAAATTSPTIPEMYEEWLAVRNASVGRDR